MRTKDLKEGKFYHYKGRVVKLLVIDKSGYKKHSTVRLIVEEQGTGWRRICRSPSKLS